MCEEYWKQCFGFSKYEVSNLGNVRSKPRVCANGRIKQGVVRKLKKKKTGYLHVNLSASSKIITSAVHRLILSSLVCPPPFEGAQVNHKNGVKHDNRIENLEWMTSSENQQHAVDTGLRVNATGSESKMTQYITIAKNIITGEEFELVGKKMMIEHGFKQASISNCALGKNVSHRGHTFRYIDLDGNEVERDTSQIKTQRYIVTATSIITGDEIRMFGERDYVKNGFTPCSISGCISGRLKTHKGYTFKREILK